MDRTLGFSESPTDLVLGGGVDLGLKKVELLNKITYGNTLTKCPQSQPTGVRNSDSVDINYHAASQETHPGLSSKRHALAYRSRRRWQRRVSCRRPNLETSRPRDEPLVVAPTTGPRGHHDWLHTPDPTRWSPSGPPL